MNKLLTPQEVADLLGVKPSTIYQWTHQGFIPYVKLGGALRFDQEEVRRWVKSKANHGRRSRRVDKLDLGL